MNEENNEELVRQGLLLEQLEHTEGFRIWRKSVCEPVLEQLDMVIAQSDSLSEPVLRAKVQLRYLLKDMFYDFFERVKSVNDQDRDINNKQ